MPHIRTVHEGEELVKRVLEALPGGVVWVAPDASILSANREAVRILGLPLDGLTNRNVTDFAPETIFEDGSPCPLSAYGVTQVLATGRAHGPATIGVKRPDGVVAWVVSRAEPVLDAEGKLVGAIATFFDISDRKRAEEKLRESELRWRSFSEHSPDFICVLDREARFVSVNRTHPQVPESAVLGRSGVSYVEPAFAAEYERHFRHVLETGEPARFETRVMSERGTRQWYDAIFVRLPGERVLVVARDITERRAMMTTLAEKDRLASVGMIAASVAHEIMNPLTYVLANLDFALGEKSTDPERRDRALREAREGASRMQQIVTDLRSLGRSGAEELLYVDARAVLETALRLAGPSLSSRTVSLELEPVPGVLASESRLCQVFLNLLVNAAESFDGPGGVVRVRTRSEEADGLVAVAIEDTGTGIAPESLPRIFEPLYTTKRAGSGLGLSICRDIVERMGGRIDVTSEPGRGSTFTIRLSTTRGGRG